MTKFNYNLLPRTSYVSVLLGISLSILLSYSLRTRDAEKCVVNGSQNKRLVMTNDWRGFDRSYRWFVFNLYLNPVSRTEQRAQI